MNKGVFKDLFLSILTKGRFIKKEYLFQSILWNEKYLSCIRDSSSFNHNTYVQNELTERLSRKEVLCIIVVSNFRQMSIKLCCTIMRKGL